MPCRQIQQRLVADGKQRALILRFGGALTDGMLRPSPQPKDAPPPGPRLPPTRAHLLDALCVAWLLSFSPNSVSSSCRKTAGRPFLMLLAAKKGEQNPFDVGCLNTARIVSFFYQ